MSAAMEGFLSLIGGFGLFLYSIGRFGDGVQKMAGERIRTILEKQAREPRASIFTGLGMAAALQSNVLTFGMISGLVNAGLLGLLPALWIMLGVNLGMTLNAHLMAINLGAIAFSFLLAGYLIGFYGKNRNIHYAGQVILNLGLMYLAFSILHRSFLLMTSVSPTREIVQTIFNEPWLGFLMGLSLSALLRSSNTVVVLTQAAVGIELGLSVPHFLSGAIAIIIGANVGTTIINMLVGLDRVPTAKTANWMHFSFNLFTGLGWIIFLPFSFALVDSFTLQVSSLFRWFEVAVFQWPAPQVLLADKWYHVWQLAAAHTLFNTSVIALWFPLTLLAAKLGLPIFNEKGKSASNGKSYLDRRALQSPALALILACHEINQMASLTIDMLKSVRLAFIKNQVHLLDGIYRNETIVDDLQEQITFYLSALLSQNSLTETQSRRLAGLLHAVSDIERVGDHANNIARLAEKKYQEQLPFSELALNEIELFFGKAIDFYSKACQALRENNLELAKQIEQREDSIVKLEEELRQNHIHRLNQGRCWPGSGVIYAEILSNLERVAAHSGNVVTVVIEEGEQ